MSFQWERTPEDALVELAEAYVATIYAKILELAHHYAGLIEEWMKDNAPWTDRSSNARQTLIGDVEELIGDTIIIILAHGMEYGVFLELAHGGRYSIIMPALDYFIPRIWASIMDLLRD